MYHAQGDYPLAETLSGEVFSLPMGPHLTFGQQDRVISALLDFKQ
jgi:dTDP-4-amino-4,6-dideoxygalactose transaminase